MKKLRFIFIGGILVVLLLTACAPGRDTTQDAQKPPADNQNDAGTDGPAESFNQNALGGCYNPFYPVAEGKTWGYELTTEGDTETFYIYYTNVSNDSFNRIVEFPDIKVETSWTCGEHGLVSLQFGTITTAGLEDLGINTLGVSGVSIPPADKWEVGNFWQAEYLTEVSFAMGENTFTGQGTITLDYVITELADVTVSAGSYENAHLVDVDVTVTIEVAGSATTMETGSTDWYVENVGLVKSESTNPDFPFTLELVSIE